MSNVFGGAEGAPSGEQINLTFQKMAGKFTSRLTFHILNCVHFYFVAVAVLNEKC